MATKKEAEPMLTARVPRRLLRALDREAKRAHRTRSAEVIFRLERSLKEEARGEPA